ncbi:MAG: hypothetical protein LBH32_01350 [Dysgonamonadaceae bacterium]|nr:hypothetical protein [Dysgonamonadaceae bacterium]
MKANIAIPVRNLLDLPIDASFSEKNGRAGAKVSRQGDSILVEATCDSLQALCEYYERELTQIHNGISVSKTELEKKVSTGVQLPLKLVLIGFIAGILLTTILFIKIKK